MKTILIVVAALGALLAAGAWLLPMVAANLSSLAGAVGLLLLVLALIVPDKPKCTGVHCSGCKHHH